MHPDPPPVPGAEPAPFPGALSFLVGRWGGEGVGGYPTLPNGFHYGQELTIAAVPGRRVLAHTSRTWDLDTGDPLAGESGWWRPGAAAGGVELLVSHSIGVLELYVGTVTGTRVELATDLVVRSATAKEVTAGARLYGLVEGDLAYAVDMAAMGEPLQAHLSARLVRQG